MELDVAGSYGYTPYIWIIMASVAFLSVLAICAFRHRTAPGALPLTVLISGLMLWVVANGLGLASRDDNARIFWWNFQFTLLLPMCSAELCFGLEYAGLGRWVNRRTVFWLAILPAALVPLIFTNEIHHLIWKRIWFDGHMRFDRGPANWGAIAYGYFVGLLYLMVLIWLFARSPRHRLMVAGLAIAFLSMRVASFFNLTNSNPVAPLNPIVFVLNFAILPYILAIFRFRMFDVVPVARDMVIERMADGMMILDIQNRIVDINQEARKLFGIIKSKRFGKQVSEILHAYPELLGLIRDSGESECEFSPGGSDACRYHASISPIVDRRGFQLGRLVSFRDITEEKRAQAQIIDQQRSLAMIKEREMLAREIHDGIGQTLGYVGIQVQSALKWLHDGNHEKAASLLERLVEVAKDAHADVRESILSLKTGSVQGWSFLPALKDYMDRFQANYGIRTELWLTSGIDQNTFDHSAGVQLLRVIQEALTNARKHSGAGILRVCMERNGNMAQISITDDGHGFDLGRLERMEDGHFGLIFMRERMAQIGGTLKIESVPGGGTVLTLNAPIVTE